MNFTPTTNIVNCMTQLLLTLQVLLTLVMPLRTTMTMTAALPVTSKPIENTAENLAWQAWLMLPPEQKQLMKSRKVTPKSIFTLPLRVECPEGHQQVDMKCIPTAIGSNAVLIDPNVLGLVLGETPGDIDYDYEDETAAGTGTGSDLDILSSMYLSDSEKSNTDAVLSLQPPSKDEPLKFNIFQSKFPTDDYPLEDYSAISNEAVVMAPSKTLNGSVGITQNKDLITEASNVSKSHSINGLSDSTGDFSLDNLEAISLPASPNHNGQQHKNRISLFNEDAALHLVTTLMDMEEGTEKDSTLSTQQTRDDLESLLQTESLMPMLNHTTVATTMPEESLTPAKDDDDDFNVMERLALHVEDMVEMTTVMAPPMDDPESEEHKEKVEHIRSVTMNSLYLQSNADADEADQGDKDELTTLTPSTVAEEDELESGETTTMPTPIIQLDDTTVIVNNNNGNGDDDDDEGFITTPTTPSLEELLEASPITTTATSSSPAPTSSTTPSSSINDGQELLLPQNLAEQDFEELQRMRKGQKDQNTMEPKKSKVEPVEVPPPSSSTLQINTAATTPKTMETKAEVVASKTTTTSTTPSSTMDELISQETVTPLLTVQHNNDDSNNAGHGDVVANNNNHNNHIDNNDRFYYQHIAQQDLESAAASATTLASDSSKLQEQSSTTTPKTAMAKADTAKAATTSEIDLAEELRLINELVKGNRQRPGQVSTMRTTSSSSSGDVNEATVSTSAAPLTLPSESSSGSMKFKLETTQIWSKIMPLLQTSSTTTSSTGTEPEEISTSSESSSIVESSTSPAAAITTTNITPKLIASNRSHRNSKIIRINRLNTIESNLSKGTTTTTTTEDISTTTEQEEITSSTASSSLSHTENSDEDQEDDVIEDNSYEPFWWFPVGWRLDSLSSRTAATTTTTTTPKTTSQNHSQDDMPLLLRFWSTYHAPKSS
uniref:Folded gastrulation N-terminal domain-containing protein n=1 Tax=Stomoxys calcitrans TaxID=35570 RepID=A0A1I8QEW3_STOCA